jgi:HlyD family secretion protein
VVVWEAADAVKAPTAALFRRGEKWAVFVIERGRARLREIELGRRNGLTAQVLSGLAPGELVIVHPPDTLGDGGRVKARQP